VQGLAPEPQQSDLLAPGLATSSRQVFLFDTGGEVYTIQFPYTVPFTVRGAGLFYHDDDVNWCHERDS
jgi:hypothetical protein